ncbi:MAG: hypothetical protein SFY69_03650 [Planctomycetota bacterium]|nr:hypothetical protein [Planctomycetota bacterium]
MLGLARATAQPAAQPGAAAAPADLSDEGVRAALEKGADLLVAMREREGEWPYEGVYRVRGEIPIGYRVGGTAIVAQALALAPGYQASAARQDAVARALAFMCAARSEALMSPDEYAGGYDVRAWGYIEAIACLATLRQRELIPAAHAGACDESLAWYVRALVAMEIPQAGGWNYARGPREEASAPSPFMTARALQALFAARAAGQEIDAGVVDRALRVLEKARGGTGSVVYSGDADRRARRADATPGAVGRMTSAECTLLLAGRGRVRDVRGAVDAFLTHWLWLEDRRAKPGTHQGPYAVAPYYFMFAHFYAAQCVERLPAEERVEYRRRVRERLFAVRDEDGAWNDRVFERSRAYGTAMAMLALMQPDLEPAAWPAEAPAPAEQPGADDAKPASAPEPSPPQDR